MKVACSSLQYEWIEDWAGSTLTAAWAHHGLAITSGGLIVGFRADSQEMCFFADNGRLVNSWPAHLAGAHGITVGDWIGEERLWVADIGLIAKPDSAGSYRYETTGEGQVVCFDLHGKRLYQFPRPESPSYLSGNYMPTAVAVDTCHRKIWIADGYGTSLVHRFSFEGQLELTLTGEEGAGRFSCPHAVFLDHRTARPRLYVTDRGNARLQVYESDGTYLYAVAEGLRAPSALAAIDDALIVADLHARLAVLDKADRLVGFIGADDDASSREGWPNAVTAEGCTIRPNGLSPGLFNSPHGLAADSQGSLYVAEWIIGGRLIRLKAC